MSYVASMLELLGGREPLGVLAELPEWIERRTAAVEDARLRRPEAPGKWSAVEVVQHLADSELVYGYRIRMVLTHPRWPIDVYDRDAWARDLRYRDVPLAGAADQLRALRAANLRLYRSLGAAELARTGLHAERGEESVELMIRLLAGHDLAHRRQLDRILGAA